MRVGRVGSGDGRAFSSERFRTAQPKPFVFPTDRKLTNSLKNQMDAAKEC